MKSLEHGVVEYFFDILPISDVGIWGRIVVGNNMRRELKVPKPSFTILKDITLSINESLLIAIILH